MNELSELVSIVIPAYNADLYLAETLEGVERQEYSSWELILVEDATSGRTEEIVQAFASRNSDHRVVYVKHEKNQGCAGSRNTAISHARGAYIAILDADDLWLPDHLKVSVKALSEQSLDVVYSSTVMFDSESGQLVHVWGPSSAELHTFPTSLYIRNYITPLTVVLRRDVFDKVGLFDDTLRLCEDIDYWLRCIRAKLNFACLPGCHTLYRKGHTEAATTRMDRVLIVHAAVLEKHLDMPEIPLQVKRYHLCLKYRHAAMSNVRANPYKASSLFYEGWKHYPWRLDCLALSVAAIGYGVGQAIGIIKRDSRAR